MSFSDKAKLTALAIVHVFETSKPFGDYGAVAVLNDGAGVSYGVSQFTHRSGSLLKVVNTYLGMGGSVGEAVLRDRMHVLMDTGGHAIRQLSNDHQFKDALKFAAETDEMKLAQNQIAENFYLLPAVAACEGSGFVLPLSLAVVYDSINHGSWDRIRDRVSGSLDERRWITTYVRTRHEWLRSKPNLKVTSYRTQFFLDEIVDGNWQLDLPVYPHGTKITDDMMIVVPEDSAVEPVNNIPASSEDPAAAELLPAEQPANGPANDPTGLVQPPPDYHSLEQQQAAGFTPEKFTAFVPQIDTAKRWFKYIGTCGTVGTIASVAAGLPLWIQVALASLVMVVVIGTVITFIKYHKEIFAYITAMNTLRADSASHDPEISADTPS